MKIVKRLTEEQKQAIVELKNSFAKARELGVIFTLDVLNNTFVCINDENVVGIVIEDYVNKNDNYITIDNLSKQEYNEIDVSDFLYNFNSDFEKLAIILDK